MQAQAHPIVACAAVLDGALKDVASVEPAFMSVGDKRAALTALASVRSQLDALTARVLAASDDVGQAQGSRDAAAWLAGETRATQRAARRELAHHHAHRDAGLAALAIGHVGDVLAAPEAALEQVVDERRRLVMRQVREQLALEPPCQIGTGLRRSDIEFRELLLLFCHSGGVPGDGAKTASHFMCIETK